MEDELLENLKRGIAVFAQSDIADSLDRIEKEYKDYNLENESEEEKAEIIMQIILNEVKGGLKLYINKFIERLEQQK